VDWIHTNVYPQGACILVEETHNNQSKQVNKGKLGRKKYNGHYL
jgi:hypothetical protein